MCLYPSVVVNELTIATVRVHALVISQLIESKRLVPGGAEGWREEEEGGIFSPPAIMVARIF